MASKTRTVKWTKSCAGSTRFAFVRSCKLVQIGEDLYLVERVTDRMPTSKVGTFTTLAEALTAIDGEPEAVCFRCGRPVMPGCQTPDAGLPCPK